MPFVDQFVIVFTILLVLTKANEKIVLVLACEILTNKTPTNIMATKIVSTPSNPATGEINQFDLKRIIEDFEDYVEIKSSSAREIKKIGRIVMRRELLQGLLDKFDEEEPDVYVSIHFGVTLPNQHSCFDNFQTDISNQLNIAILLGKENPEAVNDKIVEINYPDDHGYVITRGFRSYDSTTLGARTFGKSTEGADEMLCCGDPSKRP